MRRVDGPKANRQCRTSFEACAARCGEGRPRYRFRGREILLKVSLEESVGGDEDAEL